MGKATVPENFSVCARAFDTEQRARSVGEAIGSCIRLLSERFDLSNLDGVTVAYDYSQALLDLDRGFDSSHKLIPSDENAIGIAMTPSVLREGILKSHIVLNARYIDVLEDPDNEWFLGALHTLAHECAHVEITRRFDMAFPGVLLKTQYDDFRQAFRWQVVLACWDEYAATRLSAGIGEDPTAGYEDTFLKCLHEARPKSNDYIKLYRVHGDLAGC